MLKIERVDGLITPSEKDACKQDWRRDASTWRARFQARNQDLKDAEAIADTLETYFATLPNWKPRLNRKGERY